jgi:2-polyprenyl-3-methyl-5-hydroxy-6-metoxy-1,4-benzoquinol methylase
MHDNSATNDGYVRFLETIAEVVIANTPAEGSVLDFGCGKNAVLETIIKRQSSLNCDSYDPNFNRFLSSSETIYDTIVLCEVIEHIRDLQEELDLIELLLKKPDGRVIIRTQKYQSLETFPTWWYRQDSTHVNFFNDRSLSIFASQLSRKCIHTPYKDIVILQPETTPD